VATFHVIGKTADRNKLPYSERYIMERKTCRKTTLYNKFISTVASQIKKLNSTKYQDL